MNSLKTFDNKFITRKVKFIAGCDEAGRGPLAGPVVAAAAMFDKKTFHTDINDSKKLNEKKREELYTWILDNCLCYGVGIIDHIEIDEINILQASLKAMQIAAALLKTKPDLILIDGNKSFVSDIKTKTIVKGDSLYLSIAAASVLAKTHRDEIMKEAHKKFPQYMWDQNKGYPTQKHIAVLKEIGPSPLHRKTFMKKILDKSFQECLFKL